MALTCARTSVADEDAPYCITMVLGNKVERFRTADEALVALARFDGYDDVARWRTTLACQVALGAVVPLPLPAGAAPLLALLFECGLCQGDWVS